jgi:hypothetical protein
MYLKKLLKLLIFTSIFSPAKAQNNQKNVRSGNAEFVNNFNAICTGSLGDPVVNITFGAGLNPAQPLPAIVPGASTTLTYISVGGNPTQLLLMDNTPFPIIHLSTPGIPGRGSHRGDVNGYLHFTIRKRHWPGI